MRAIIIIHSGIVIQGYNAPLVVRSMDYPGMGEGYNVPSAVFEKRHLRREGRRGYCTKLCMRSIIVQY